MLSQLVLDQTLHQWITAYGPWTLGLVATVIFAETGLVLAPFLPGDSLLFVTGMSVASTSLNVHTAVAVLALAAILGDTLNFTVGRHATSAVMKRLSGRWLRPSHVHATHAYFERFGASTIVVARFIPVVRTAAPFLAGAGRMPYRRFALFNAVGAWVWVGAFVYAGAFLGTQDFVRQNLGAILIGIVAPSLIPLGVAGMRAFRTNRGCEAALPVDA